MKNWKCIIGATLLTPICAVVGIGLGVGFIWLVENVPIMKYIMFTVVGIGCLVGLVAIWATLFDHCKKRWQKKL